METSDKLLATTNYGMISVKEIRLRALKHVPFRAHVVAL
jgi:hypothetical protein